MRRLGAVSFDCWSTLIYETDPDRSRGERVARVQGAAQRLGLARGLAHARQALDVAWQRHWDLWQQGSACGAGMRTVRIRGYHDDTASLPDADQVADSHAHLLEILGIE